MYTVNVSRKTEANSSSTHWLNDILVQLTTVYRGVPSEDVVPDQAMLGLGSIEWQVLSTDEVCDKRAGTIRTSLRTLPPTVDFRFASLSKPHPVVR